MTGNKKITVDEFKQLLSGYDSLEYSFEEKETGVHESRVRYSYDDSSTCNGWIEYIENYEYLLDENSHTVNRQMVVNYPAGDDNYSIIYFFNFDVIEKYREEEHVVSEDVIKYIIREELDPSVDYSRKGFYYDTDCS